jgi:hypothetical protein
MSEQGGRVMNEQERGEQQWGRAILALAVKKLA